MVSHIERDSDDNRLPRKTDEFAIFITNILCVSNP
jgi:hypothetical protein